ncbi:hypothetical protein [Sulfurovum sp. NBC37-1]|uniref:hypothetical protein n=1 Tax=Sulfurovum sp. (strain NBC37-1) TaxID=387093 RepID=UPI0001587AB0|nr:hypothetical protein [Sulfurovum sp. NBC37-1]BAF73024.1 hypothetical protein SUN_2083 [Sulfurovum sp. NBC37-1]BAF73027.1 hypothetical protein SUN_2086 [Sulfurovum sp. NBC37-1]
MQNKKTKILLVLAMLLMIGGTMLQAGSGKSVQKTQKAKKAGWYMRTRVSATAEDGSVYEHNSAGVFGELKQSKAKKDRHDVAAYGPAVLQVVFPHYDWEEGDAGDYWSDYRKYKKARADKRAVWTFQVKNQKTVDLSNAEIHIKLDDAIKVNYIKENGNVRYIEIGTDKKMKKRFILVDVDNHQTYSVDELEYANLSMDGNHTRTFRWVRGDVRKKDFKPVVLPE